ncbi:MAG: TIGR03620 family F420-dependent LLM class oxidoreductase [Acidimicrobiales bacterium]
MSVNEQTAGEGSSPSRQLASVLGPVGLWTMYLQYLTTPRAAEVLAIVEDAGMRAVWSGEGANTKEALTNAAVLLASTKKLIVATGIANIWARDPVAMAAGARLLAEAYPGRFILGMGVSHAPNVAARGYDEGVYVRPLTRMRRYLDAMDAARLTSPAPATPPPRLLAALRPKMLRLAAQRTLGAHPFFVTVDHTARAREVLGPDPVLAPEHAVVLESDRSTARALAADYVDHRLDRENYRNHLLALGFTEADLDHGGSDGLFDQVVAWGDVDAIAARVRAHLDAGADHVAVDIIARQGEDFPIDDFLRLAPALRADQLTPATTGSL